MEPVLPGPGAWAPPALTDLVLEEIFIRIDTPADLACASAACKAFRRLITDPTFLRRYRSLHPPLLLGFIHPNHESQRFVPAAVPHPNALAAQALAAAADFSFGHLPHRQGTWCPCDARNGRVLLGLMYSEPEGKRVLPELAVTDPLTLETTLLPPLPDGLFTSAKARVQKQAIEFFHFDAFFDPSETESYNEADFRVLWWSATIGAVFVYSSVSGTWNHCASISTGLRQPGFHNEHFPGPCPGVVSYACGRLYRKPEGSNKLITLDLDSMEFSIVRLSSDYKHQDAELSEIREGRIGIFSLNRTLGDPPCYFIRHEIHGGNANEQPVDTTVPLPDEHNYFLDGAAEGYIFIVGYRNIGRGLMPISALFSLEVKTMKLERVGLSTYIPYHLIPYFGYPPFMSPRRM